MFKPVLGYAAVLCIALLGFVHAADNCPSSANACVNEYKEDFDKLSQQDTSYYCEQGAKIAAKAQNCLKRCGFSEDHAVLQQEKKKINSFCKGVDAKCDAVCDTFVNQTRSFDNDGGLDAVMTALKTQFSNGEAINCVKFYNGRYLQKTQTCPFNARLDISIVQENPVILLGLAICGSETLKSLVPYVDATDGCKPNAEKTIIEKCNVSCPMANAQDPRTLCGYMEYQAKCLEENTAGCTNLQKKLVLPRLNSYAIANRYLGCSINFTGLPVKSTRKGCNYSEPINACMLTKKPENSLNFFALQPLLNFDTLVGEFCSSKKTQADMIIACRNAFIPCAPVQAKVLTTSDMSSIASFMPELGVAPLDQFGMQYIYDAQIPATCPPGLKWSERICIPDNKRDYDDKSIQTTEEKKESKSTKVSRSTPPGQTTPPKKTHGTTPKKGANDFQHQTSKGNGYTQVNGYTPTKKATKKRVDDFEIRTTEVHKPGNPQHLSSKGNIVMMSILLVSLTTIISILINY